MGGMGFTMTDTLHGQIVGSSHETTRRILVEAFGASFPYTLFDEQCRALMHSRMADAVPVKPGAAELIEELKARRIPMAVATSSRAVHALSQLGAAGLLDHFAAVVTRDDVTQPKPHPEPYLTAVRQLGVAPAAALAIEDSGSGIRSAHAAGLQTVLVPDLVDADGRNARVRPCGIRRPARAAGRNVRRCGSGSRQQHLIAEHARHGAGDAIAGRRDSAPKTARPRGLASVRE